MTIVKAMICAYLCIPLSYCTRIHGMVDERLEDARGEWWYEQPVQLDERDVKSIENLLVQVLQGKKQDLDKVAVRKQLVALIDRAIEQEDQVKRPQHIQ